MATPIQAQDVKPEQVDWLWRERIPRGMFTVVAGRPDQGKGLFCAHVAAEVSKAGGKVLYSAIEDSHGLMTRPRLEAAGANLKNVLLWRFQLPAQFREMSDIVVNQEIDLIIIDPFAAHLGHGISRHSDNVREVINPFTELIEMTNTAVLITEHALKRVSANAHPLTAIGGSGSGLPAASRMAYLFGVDPSDPDRRVLACCKSNIRETPQAVTFEVDTVDIESVDKDVPALIFDGETIFDPIRLVVSERQSGKIGRPPDKRAAAAEWLTTYLADAGKPVPAGTVMEDAKQYGMTTKTLRRAADDMAIVRNPPGGGRNCTWDLPDEIKDLMGKGDDDDVSAVPGPADSGDPEDDGGMAGDAVDALLDSLGIASVSVDPGVAGDE